MNKRYEFWITDRNTDPELTRIEANSLQEATTLYRQARYPNRKACPSGIVYERRDNKPKEKLKKVWL